MLTLPQILALFLIPWGVGIWLNEGLDRWFNRDDDEECS